jgi:hypothetical protein
MIHEVTRSLLFSRLCFGCDNPFDAEQTDRNTMAQCEAKARQDARCKNEAVTGVITGVITPVVVACFQDTGTPDQHYSSPREDARCFIGRAFAI